MGRASFVLAAREHRSRFASTIAELKLKPGWWRLSPDSAEVYLCERYGACDGTRTDDGNATATLRSGIDGLGCREGHRGPLCSVCEAGWAGLACDSPRCLAYNDATRSSGRVIASNASRVR